VVVQDRDPPSRVGLRLLTRHGETKWQAGCQGRYRKLP
jgi:hypothetical protein